MTKRRIALLPRRYWSAADDARLRELYPDLPTPGVARVLRRSLSAVYARVSILGLGKSPAYLARKRAAEAARLRAGGVAHRFPEGHVPANKGLRRPGYSVGRGRMQETQFKKGERTRNWMPIGSLRLKSDGYLDAKCRDTGYPPADWRGVHLLLWEAKHGPIPAGHCVRFKDGDKRNVWLANLELITLRENALRNSIHNLPLELVQVIQLTGTIKRTINMRGRKHGEEQAAGPA